MTATATPTDFDGSADGPNAPGHVPGPTLRSRRGPARTPRSSSRSPRATSTTGRPATIACSKIRRAMFSASDSFSSQKPVRRVRGAPGRAGRRGTSPGSPGTPRAVAPVEQVFHPVALEALELRPGGRELQLVAVPDLEDQDLVMGVAEVRQRLQEVGTSPKRSEMITSNPRRCSFGTRSWKTSPSSVSPPGLPFCSSSISTRRWLTRERGGM